MRTVNLKLAILVFLLAGNASIGIAQLLGTFTPTGDMSFPRSFHTATLLADGKVGRKSLRDRCVLKISEQRAGGRRFDRRLVFEKH